MADLLKTFEYRDNIWLQPLGRYKKLFPELNRLEDNPLYLLWRYQKTRQSFWRVYGINLISYSGLVLFNLFFTFSLPRIVYAISMLLCIAPAIIYGRKRKGSKSLQYLFQTENEDLLRDLSLSTIDRKDLVMGGVALSLTRFWCVQEWITLSLVFLMSGSLFLFKFQCPIDMVLLHGVLLFLIGVENYYYSPYIKIRQRARILLRMIQWKFGSRSQTAKYILIIIFLFIVYMCFYLLFIVIIGRMRPTVQGIGEMIIKMTVMLDILILGIRLLIGLRAAGNIDWWLQSASERLDYYLRGIMGYEVPKLIKGEIPSLAGLKSRK